MKHKDEYLKVDLYLRDALTIDKKLGLKIGASSDLYYGREKSYKSDANRGRIYSTKRGDFIDEKALQLYFSDYSISGESEIFEYSENYIIPEFDRLSFHEVYSELWERRNSIFNIQDIKITTTKRHEILKRAIKEVNICINNLPLDSMFNRELANFVMSAKAGNSY